MDSVALCINVESPRGEVPAIDKFEVGYINTTLSGYLIVVKLLLPHVLWVIGVTELYKPVAFIVGKDRLGPGSTAVTTIIE